LPLWVAQEWERKPKIFLEPAVILDRVLADSDDFDWGRKGLKEVVLFFEGQASTLTGG
jgi:hypothetical protein